MDETELKKELYWKTKEVAALFGVTGWTVLQWIYSDKLKAYKAGGQWRISNGDLKKFLKEKE